MIVLFNLNNNWLEPEIDNSDVFRLTTTWDNLENPTNFVADVSYSITLPRCAKNENIFSNVLKMDSRGFNGNELIPTKILDNQRQLIVEGHSYIANITHTKIELSFIGMLATVFNKMLHAGYDEEDEYQLQDFLSRVKRNTQLLYGTNVLNKDVVKEHNNLTFMLAMMGNYTTNQYINSIVTFMPTNCGRYEDFESNKWLSYLMRSYCQNYSIYSVFGGIPSYGNYPLITDCFLDGTIKIKEDGGSFKDTYLYHKNQNLPIMADSAHDTGEGFTQFQMNEFRSYYLTPYVKVRSLLDMLKIDFHSITGYNLTYDINDIELDNQVLYALPLMYDKEDGVKTLVGETIFTEQTGGVFTLNEADVTFNPQNPLSLSNNVIRTGLDTSWLTCTGDSFICQVGKSYNINWKTDLMITQHCHLRQMTQIGYLSDYNPLLVEFDLVDTNGNSVLTYPNKYVIMPEEQWVPATGNTYLRLSYFTGETPDYILSDLAALGYKQVNTKLFCSSSFDMHDLRDNTWMASFEGIDLNLKFNPTISHVANGSVLTPRVRVRFATKYAPFVNINGYGGLTQCSQWLGDEITITSHDSMTVNSYDAVRTGKILSCKTLFKDIKPFEIIIKYAKLKHLIWVIDDINQTVRLVKSSTYLKEQWDANKCNEFGLYDWASENINPLTWDSRYVIFNYDDVDIEYDYEVSYGSKKLITECHINTEETKLLEGFVPPVISNVEYRVINAVNQVGFNSLTTKTTPPLSLNNNNMVAGSFWYKTVPQTTLTYGYPKIKTVHWDLGVDNYYITDDTEIELNENTYCWHGDSLHTAPKYAVPAISRLPHSFDMTISDSYFTNIENPYPSAIYTLPAITDRLDTTLLFSTPRKYFTDFVLPEVPSLFEANWLNYVTEIYNPKNKTLVIDAYLSVTEFNKLKKNPFLRINDVLYFCTKIDEWADNDGKCKLTLRTVDMLNNLISDDTELVTISGDCINGTVQFIQSIYNKHIGDTITAQVIPSSGYTFYQWNDGNTLNPRTFTIDSNPFNVSASCSRVTHRVILNVQYGQIRVDDKYFTKYDEYLPEGSTLIFDIEPDKSHTIAQTHYEIFIDKDITEYYECVPNRVTLTLFGDNCLLEGAGDYDFGLKVVISCKPNIGYKFVEWSDGDKFNPRTIIMDNNYTLDAKVIPVDVPTFIITTEGVNCDVTGGGAYKVGTEVQLYAKPYDGYTFYKWDDGVMDNPRTINVESNAHYTAYCETQSKEYTVKVTGINCKVLGEGTYAEGQTCKLLVLPDNGFSFISWNDGDTKNPREIVVTEDIELIATCASLVTLSVINAVTAPYLINGEPYKTDAKATFPVGMEITLEAENIFNYWIINDEIIKENPYSFVLEKDIEVVRK